MNTENPVIQKWYETTKEKYGHHVQGGRLARFAKAVVKNRAFLYFNELYLRRRSTIDGNGNHGPTPVQPTQKEKIELVFEAARTGCCETVPFASEIKDIVNLADEEGITALHVAVENGHYKDVEFLLKTGANIKPDKQGLTPLHIAASSAEPNPKIATALVEWLRKNDEERRVNEMESTRGNTALHFAAENEHISREFIQALYALDPSIENNNGRTAFHLAAENDSPDVIVSMLELFTPAIKGWEMKQMEKNSEPTLLEICVRKGNKEAVVLLIKYGAKKSENVKIFFYLIDESVKNPTKTDKLIGVYRTLTHHCVLWDWLTKKSDKQTKEHCPPRRGTEPDKYKAEQRSIMMKLLTESNEDYGNRNVLEHAIEKGDRVFLNEILNTLDVFRMTDYVSKEEMSDQSHSDQSKDVKYDVTYDITNFLNSPRRCRFTFFQTIRRKLTGKDNKVGPTKAPRRPYLDLIIRNRHRWENTDIFQTEPFLTITQPMCRFVQLIHFVMAVIQLVYIISFSILFTPSYCLLKRQLNLDQSAQYNSSAIPPEPSAVIVSQFFALLNFLWLPWPTAVCLGTIIIRFPHRKWGQRAYGFLSSRLVFAPLLWAWYFTTFIRRELYLSLTSAVYLFGWLDALSFVISALESASIFSFLLLEIVVKDIAASFGIVFFFLLVSFSSAIHLLRESALLGESGYFDTMYNMFASALTTGSFMSETAQKSTDVTARYRLIQAMFAIYLCCATIILLNILITMMNNRYEEVRKKAQNVWRFRNVHSWLQLSLCFGVTQKILQFYWKFATHRFWKKVANTTHDEVIIAEKDNNEVLLHMVYTTDHDDGVDPKVNAANRDNDNKPSLVSVEEFDPSSQMP